MGELVSMATVRARREARARTIAAADHPSLRWVAGDEWWRAHRRAAGGTACGAPGPLVLAPPGVPPCRDCYPT